MTRTQIIGFFLVGALGVMLFLWAITRGSSPRCHGCQRRTSLIWRGLPQCPICNGAVPVYFDDHTMRVEDFTKRIERKVA